MTNMDSSPEPAFVKLMAGVAALQDDKEEGSPLDLQWCTMWTQNHSRALQL